MLHDKSKLPGWSEKDIRKIFLWIGIFSVAFGFLEAIIVIYLRQMYYPNGFEFPLTLIPDSNYKIELLRETSTIIMLISVGILVGRNAIQKLVLFLYAFGVWDIFFYIALKLLIRWPASLFTWDLLFLIPVAWDGPVLSPVICSVTMIFFAGRVMYFSAKGYNVTLNKREWPAVIAGVILILVSFMWDYSSIIVRNIFVYGFHATLQILLNEEMRHFIPSYFHWGVFLTGEVFILAGIFLMIRRIKRSRKEDTAIS